MQMCVALCWGAGEELCGDGRGHHTVQVQCDLHRQEVSGEVSLLSPTATAVCAHRAHTLAAVGCKLQGTAQRRTANILVAGMPSRADLLLPVQTGLSTQNNTLNPGWQ